VFVVVNDVVPAVVSVVSLMSFGVSPITSLITTIYHHHTFCPVLHPYSTPTLPSPTPFGTSGLPLFGLFGQRCCLVLAGRSGLVSQGTGARPSSLPPPWSKDPGLQAGRQYMAYSQSVFVHCLHHPPIPSLCHHPTLSHPHTTPLSSNVNLYYPEANPSSPPPPLTGRHVRAVFVSLFVFDSLVV
jgi:hypothetical protein